MLPRNTGEAWLRRFCGGLAEDQKEFGITLAGGDTTSTNGPACFSLTALGTVPIGQALRRNGAKAGDVIYVSGTLGDSALGLALLQNNLDCGLSACERQHFINRYELPCPRIELAKRLRGIATAAIDISDGLMQDLGHLCRASEVGACVERNALPLSASAAKIEESKRWNAAIAGGDDYELLFTVPATQKDLLSVEALKSELRLTEIGFITHEKEVRLADEDGETIPLAKTGFQHF
jgi:thiamine-monophosphate kinase